MRGERLLWFPRRECSTERLLWFPRRECSTEILANAFFKNQFLNDAVKIQNIAWIIG
jgi:hypothetical protein